MPQNDPLSNKNHSGLTAWNLAYTWILAFLVAATLYVATTAPGILWGDSGEAQLRVLIGQLQDARELARSHVVYFAAAIGVTRLSGGNPVDIANTLSALAGAVTVANFAVLLACLVKRKASLVGGTCLLLFSHTLWQMSAGAEVVTFSTMFLSLELLCFVQFVRHRQYTWLAGAALANGLGWSTHNFALLIWPAYFVVIFFRPPWLATLNWRKSLTIASMWLIGVAPLAISLILKISNPDETGDLFRSVFVGIYGRNVFNLNVTTGMAFRVAAYTCLNFPTPLLLLAPVGIWHLWRTQCRSTWLFLFIASISFFLFAARYNVPDQYTFLTHSHLFLALFIAIGLDRFLCSNRSAQVRAMTISLCFVSPIFYAVLPTIAERHLSNLVKLPQRVLPYRPPYEWFLQPWRCGNNGAERYAKEVLESLPQNAALLVDSTTGRPIDLVQGMEGIRLDVRVPSDLFDRPWQSPLALDEETLDRLITEGLLFAVNDRHRFWGGKHIGDQVRFEPFGFVYRIVQNNPADDLISNESEPQSPP